MSTHRSGSNYNETKGAELVLRDLLKSSSPLKYQDPTSSHSKKTNSHMVSIEDP